MHNPCTPVCSCLQEWEAALLARAGTAMGSVLLEGSQEDKICGQLCQLGQELLRALS